MKNSEIRKQAQEIIKDIFLLVTSSENKEVWEKALTFASWKIAQLEATTRWEEMFVWRRVHYILVDLYEKKFIL